MYEKFTSCFLLQRASISTLPFGIDDPANKPTKGNDLSDDLVDLYNKGKTGSLGRTTVEPKSVPLVTTNYRLKQEERVQSRLCIIPFAKPSIAPITDEQQEAYDELDDLLAGEELSSVCGWAIAQRAALLNNESHKVDIEEFFPGESGHQLGLCCHVRATSKYYLCMLPADLLSC